MLIFLATFIAAMAMLSLTAKIASGEFLSFKRTSEALMPLLKVNSDT